MTFSSVFSSHVLRVCDLACRRGGVPVFEGLAFEARSGQAIAVTGANGSGKTSLLRVVGGLMKPDTGQAELTAGGLPSDLLTASHYIGHELGLELGRTVWANLAFAAAQCGERGDRGLLDMVGLGAHMGASARQLSAGQRKRLALVRLLVAPRPLWLLDEPASALDAAGVELLCEIAGAHLAAGGLILAATHGALPFQVAAELRMHGPAGRAVP